MGEVPEALSLSAIRNDVIETIKTKKSLTYEEAKNVLALMEEQHSVSKLIAELYVSKFTLDSMVAKVKHKEDSDTEQKYGKNLINFLDCLDKQRIPHTKEKLKDNVFKVITNFRGKLESDSKYEPKDICFLFHNGFLVRVKVSHYDFKVD